jgi:hypothetical protein
VVVVVEVEVELAVVEEFEIEVVSLNNVVALDKGVIVELSTPLTVLFALLIDELPPDAKIIPKYLKL